MKFQLEEPLQLYSQDSEQALLGCLLIDPEQYLDVCDLVGAADFHVHKHRWVWDAFTRLHNQEGAVDVLTLSLELERKNELVEVGGTAYLAQLMTAPPSSQHAVDYAVSVKRFSVRRNLWAAAVEIANLASDADLSTNEMLNRADSIVREVENGSGNRRELLTQEQAVAAFYQDMAERAGARHITGLPTGFSHLDRATNGLPRKFAVVAGRPSMGKTSLLSQIANEQARLGLRVGVATLEVKAKAWVQAAALAELGLDSMALKEDDWPRITEKCDELMGLPIAYYDKGQCDVLELERAIYKMERQLGGLDVLYLDHLGYLDHLAGKRSMNPVYAIGQSTKRLASISKEMEIAVTAACQLNRASARAGDPPQLTDLRDSGEIEQDARLVLMAHRPDYYSLQPPSKYNAQDAIIYVRKNEEGPTGKVTLAFVPAFRRFTQFTSERNAEDV